MESEHKQAKNVLEAFKKPRKSARPTPRGEANARIEEAIETGLKSKLLGHALASKMSRMEKKNHQEEKFRNHNEDGPEKDRRLVPETGRQGQAPTTEVRTVQFSH